MVGATKSKDGVEIHYESTGKGEPTTLVFVHGWSCNRSYWRAQTDHFAQSHHVVAVDLGGHGESGFGRHKWTMTAFGEDVHAVVEALDLTDVVLIGHSMGALAIVEACRRMPDRVRGLIAVEYFQNVERQMTEQEIADYLTPLRDDFPKHTEEFVREYFPTSANHAIVDRIAKDMASAPPKVAISAIEHICRYDQGRGLSSIDAPMWLINSDFWPTDLQAARKYKPDLQLTILPGLGHFVMLEDPEVFNRVLSAAIGQLAPRE